MGEEVGGGERENETRERIERHEQNGALRKLAAMGQMVEQLDGKRVQEIDGQGAAAQIDENVGEAGMYGSLGHGKEGQRG